MTDKTKLQTYFVMALALIAIFILYIIYRQKYVGACDWYAYYSHGQLLKSGQLHMKTELDPKEFTAIIPIGYYVRDGEVIPHFPPGYPLLLAIFGLVGLEYFVNPLLGVLFTLLMYLILIKLTDKWIAAAFALLWALSPIAFWGSTQVMSDLSAGFFILLVFYFYTKGKTIPAGLIFGLSLLIRPSNIVFGLALLPLLIKERQFLKFTLYSAITTSISAVYNWYMHGLPWKYGFYSAADIFSPAGFLEKYLVYSREMISQYTPIFLLLALVALWKRRKDTMIYFFAAWFFVFFLFYCFVIFGGEAWWSTRFLLPGIPALFFLAAMGLKDSLEIIAKKWPRLTTQEKFKPAFLMVFCLLMSVYFFFILGKDKFQLNTNKGKIFYDVALKVKSLVPANSLIGSLDMSGALRLYANLESFNLMDTKGSSKIFRKMLKKRPVYIIKSPPINIVMEKFYNEVLVLFQYEPVVKLTDDKTLVRIVRRKLQNRAVKPGN